MPYPDHHQKVIERFVSACRTDERVRAALIGGSYARGAADAHSDLDLCVITSDDAHAAFAADRKAFIRQLGEIVFLEDFDLPNLAFFVLADGNEGELHYIGAAQLEQLECGPFMALVDKQGLLAGAVFPEARPAPAEQQETLRRQIYWFWHELSHFITAMQRGQMWWAYGQLEALRRHCVCLARLRHRFLEDAGGNEPYFKIEQTLPIAAIEPLRSTCCAIERGAILRAAQTLLDFYRDAAVSLARAHDLVYPDKLDQILSTRLAALVS